MEACFYNAGLVCSEQRRSDVFVHRVDEIPASHSFGGVGGNDKLPTNLVGFDHLIKSGFSPLTKSSRQSSNRGNGRSHSSITVANPSRHTHTQKHVRFPGRRPVYESATVHSGSASAHFKHFTVNRFKNKQTKKNKYIYIYPRIARAYRNKATTRCSCNPAASTAALRLREKPTGQPRRGACELAASC